MFLILKLIIFKCGFEKVNFTEVANLGGKYSFYFMILFIEFNELKTTSGYLIFTTFIIHIKSLQY